MKTEINEYRKQSAKRMGFTLSKDKYYGDKNHAFILEVNWLPNQNANQMLMVWEWLKKNDKDVIYRAFNDSMRNNKDIKLTTMKAFMEYIKLT